MTGSSLAVILMLLPAISPQDQQVGARTKAMGGSYTAFEDDPVSIWLNPAEIASQPNGMAISYQSYTIYEPKIEVEDIPPDYFAEYGWAEPAIVPSFVGFTFQLGNPESPHAIGICFAAPFRLKFGWVEDGVPAPEHYAIITDQFFYRIRGAYAHSIRFKPPGAPGWLTHLAFGIGLDINVTNWTYTKEEFLDQDPGPLFDPGNTYTLTVSGTDMGFGGGAGLLLGLYDNTTDFKVNIGLAYQSSASYQFSYNFDSVPLSDWPSQLQFGVTCYLFEGFPLRVTADIQVIAWNKATRDSALAGFNDFRNATNLSLGVEYKVKASETVSVYPRLGLRRYDPPWHDKNSLPAIGDVQLDIRTDDDRFLIVTGGLGVSWAAENGILRSFNIAFDFGGDASGVAMGFSTEF